MILNIIALCIISIIFVIIAVDIVPILSDWLSRIHIGKYEDKKVWSKAVTSIGVEWLIKTPTIKITDNKRLVLIDMLKKNYAAKAIQYWQEAALILGLSEFLKYNEDKVIKHQIIKFLVLKFDENGQWRDPPAYVDGAMLAYAVMKLKSIDTDKYKNALDYTWNVIKGYIGEDGTVQYRKQTKNYRYVDTIGFICPFLASYGVRYNNDECISLAINQIQQYEKYGMFIEHYIPCHAYKIQNKVPLGLYGWGRGLGWFSIGIIDFWNELPKENKYKCDLEKIIIRFAKTAMKLQQENGGWSWLVTRDECREDSSAVAALCWFMLSASSILEISKECLESAEKALGYLITVTRRNGAVDFSQGDTKDVGVYSMLFNIMPFTQGFTIRCINKYLNMQQSVSNNSVS